MAKVIRTFVGIPVPQSRALLEVLRSLKQMGNPVRPVHIDRLHLTLSFLGETPFEQVPEICNVLDSIVQNHSPFEIDLNGIGAFPNQRRPSVIWAGVSPEREIVALADEITAKLLDLGYPREKRQFRPHLTLAYVKGRVPSEFLSIFEENSSTIFGQSLVSEINYYQSVLKETGPSYQILSTHTLGDSSVSRGN